MRKFVKAHPFISFCMLLGTAEVLMQIGKVSAWAAAVALVLLMLGFFWSLSEDAERSERDS
jgi:hypothetical protein